MANITQTIHSLTAGISQQPDEQKIPGQVKDMVNAMPDVTQGLLKRPAGKFVSTLTGSTSDGKWFHYYRDENEQYIGQVARNGTVRMWACTEVKVNGSVIHQAGAPVTVVDGIGNNTYLAHTGDEDIQTLTLNDFTYLTNRTVTTEMDTVNGLATVGDFNKEVFVELKQISYAKQYSMNVFDQDGTQDSHFTTSTTATRINVERVRDSNNYCDSSGYMVEHSPRGTAGHRCTANAGDGRDAYAPNVGTRIFSVDSNKTLTDGSATGGTKSGGSLTDTQYDYAVRVYAQGGSGSGSDYVSGRENLYFRIATTGQSVPFTTGSGENQTTTYQARYTTTYDLLHGGEGWLVGDFFYVWMKDGFYKITIDTISTSKQQANLAMVRPQPTPFDNETTITAESILGDIRQELIDDGIAASDITQIGIGLHIKRSSAFNASTGVGELLNVVAGQVNDIGDLPSQCKNGMVVEVINSVADEDNHYVKFIGNNGRDGEGTWQECPKPGRKCRFKYSKMPVALIRTADANFRLTQLDDSQYTVTTASGNVTDRAPFWDDALVGDEVTNREPSFIGRTINKMLFFRNRFTILSEEYIVMSRPGDFLNFWSKSAISFIASDPIDISASSEYPAEMYDGIQVNTGLVLFSKNQQYMLTTDSDVFSPLTAKINALSTYNFNFATNPISLGTTIGFLDNAGKNSRFYEMAGIRREGEPEIIEQSAVVSRLFESDLKTISNSRENAIILFSEDSSSSLYGYRYFDQIRERKLASWFRWTLPGTIKYHCMQDDALYVVLENGTSRELLKYAIKMDSETTQLAENRVHMDYLMTQTSLAASAYSSGKTTFPKPSGLNGVGQIAAYDIDDPADPSLTIGNYGLVTDNNDGTLSIDGDWTGQSFLIGYLYTMSVTLPTIYYVVKDGESFRSDTRSNTIVHRVKLGFGPVGVYETTLARQGRTDYTELFEVTPANQYSANTTGIFDDNILRTVPIYDRNINASLTIKSTHPSPATIHNLTWEGVYTTNNYKRV